MFSADQRIEKRLKANQRANLGLGSSSTASQVSQSGANSNVGTGVPMERNGNIIHDIHTVRGLGATLSRAPVSQELRHAQKTYPQWSLPSTVSSPLSVFAISLINSTQAHKPSTSRKPSDNNRGSRFAVSIPSCAPLSRIFTKISEACYQC